MYISSLYFMSNFPLKDLNILKLICFIIFIAHFLKKFSKTVLYYCKTFNSLSRIFKSAHVKFYWVSWYMYIPMHLPVLYSEKKNPLTVKKKEIPLNAAL